MTDPTAAFAKMVPGFDFLQGLVKNAGAAIPAMGQWIAPTLNPEELDKRIGELRTVQFWLEQNARMLGATIQALEVQRMTLNTLQTMNVSLGDLTESLKIRMPGSAPATAAAQPPSPPPPPPEKPAQAAALRNPFFFAPAAEPAPMPAAAPTPAPGADGHAATEPTAAVSPPGVADPMQWWGALTRQFTELATNALKDSNSDAVRNLAGNMVKQGIEAAGATLKSATAGSLMGSEGGSTTSPSAAKPRAAAKRPGGVAETKPSSSTAAGPKTPHSTGKPRRAATR